MRLPSRAIILFSTTLALAAAAPLHWAESQRQPFAAFARFTEAPADHPAMAAARLALHYTDTGLPDGVGGVRFYTSLGGPGGLASPASGSIAIALGAPEDGYRELITHERAHLLHAHMRAEVDAILATLPPPAPDHNAATSPQEHFAEMAVSADRVFWSGSGTQLRPHSSQVEHLRELERAVPGTAGMLLLRLDVTRLDTRLPWPWTYDDVREEATRLTRRPAVWRPLREALMARRDVHGQLAPWPALPLAAVLDLHRRDSPMLALFLAPSTALARIID